MTQLHLFYPPKISIDGYFGPGDNVIRYIGDATYSHGEGFYRCLAEVSGALCVVEVRLRLQ